MNEQEVKVADDVMGAVCDQITGWKRFWCEYQMPPFGVEVIADNKDEAEKRAKEKWHELVETPVVTSITEMEEPIVETFTQTQMNTTLEEDYGG